MTGCGEWVQRSRSKLLHGRPGKLPAGSNTQTELEAQVLSQCGVWRQEPERETWPVIIQYTWCRIAGARLGTARARSQKPWTPPAGICAFPLGDDEGSVWCEGRHTSRGVDPGFGTQLPAHSLPLSPQNTC